MTTKHIIKIWEILKRNDKITRISKQNFDKFLKLKMSMIISVLFVRAKPRKSYLWKLTRARERKKCTFLIFFASIFNKLIKYSRYWDIIYWNIMQITKKYWKYQTKQEQNEKKNIKNVNWFGNPHNYWIKFSAFH